MGLVKTTRNVGYFCSYILQRIERNKNFMGCITGPTGSGKTYAALRLAEQLDPDFTIDRLVFEAEEFMRLLNNSQNLKRGSVIIWDEAGVGQSARAWQSMANKLINYVLQTFRHKNYIVLFTSPDFSFVDAQTRKLFHGTFETVGINKRTKTCALKPLLIQVNQRSGVAYFKYLRVVTSDGAVPFKRLRVGLPSKELIKVYEERKTAYTKELNERIEAELMAAREKKLNKHKKELTPMQEEIVESLRNGLRVDDIAKLHSITTRAVHGHINYIKRKGVKIRPVKDGVKILRYEVGGVGDNA